MEGTGIGPHRAHGSRWEAVYYAMSRLSDTVAPEKLVLQLTTTASVWTDGKRDASVTGAQAAQWAESGALREYYSSEYACAYLSGTMDKQERVVWYLNGDAVKERTVLAACFGINQVCLTSLEELWPGLLRPWHNGKFPLLKKSRQDGLPGRFHGAPDQQVRRRLYILQEKKKAPAKPAGALNFHSQSGITGTSAFPRLPGRYRR